MTEIASRRIPVGGAIAAALLMIGLLVVVTPKAALAAVAVVSLAPALARPRELVLYALPVSLLAPVSVFVYQGAGPNLTVERAAVLVASGAAVASFAVGRVKALRVPPLVRAAFLAFATYILLVAVAAPSGAAFHQALSLTVGAAAPALLVAWAVRSRHDAWRLVEVLAAVGTAVSLLAIIESVLNRHLVAQAPGLIFYSSDRAGRLRAQSVFPHPIVLGLAIDLILPLTLALWLHGRRRIALGAAGVQATALVLTFSRGPWVGAIAAVAVMAAARGLRGGRLVVLLTVAVVTVAVSPLGGPAGTAARAVIHPQTSSDVATLDYRRELFRASWAYMKRHPFGSNLNPALSPTLLRDVNGNAVDVSVSVDNAYLKYGLQIGIVGVALVCLLLAALAWHTLRQLRQHGGPLAAGLAGAQVAMLLVSSTVATFSWEQAGIIFAIIAGLSLSDSSYGGP